MNPAVQSVICGKRLVQVTKTFTANATWTAPVTTSRVDASGKGADGTPAGPVYSYYSAHTVYYGTRRDNGNTDVNDGGTTFGNTGAKPSDFCTGWSSSPENPTYTGSFYCVTYSGYTTQTPGTTGASATAFSKTFPGGVNGPATVTNFTGIVVTPGANYNIVVPTGGSLTITYYQ